MEPSVCDKINKNVRTTVRNAKKLYIKKTETKGGV